MIFVEKVMTNILKTLYQPFLFAVMTTFFISSFYLYAHNPLAAGRGVKEICKAWFDELKTSSFFKSLNLLIFFFVMIIFKTLLCRNTWLNPVQNVLGPWWIWKANSTTGEIELTTECFENILLMMPLTFLWLTTKYYKGRSKIGFRYAVLQSVKVSFLFSFTIEMLQLFLRLGTWQLSDLFYNTLGGFIGGLIYWIGFRIKHKKD